MATLEERLTKAEDTLKKPSFRQNKGLGNEVGYYVFAYPPEEELKMRRWVKHLLTKYESGADGFRVIAFDLYDIVIDILQSKGYLDKCCEFERTKGFERITKAVGNTLRITSQDNLIVRHILDVTPDNVVVFLTGIGKCYPLLRTHTVLNQLHQVLDHVPVVMLYPGKYDGQELILFGEIKDENYYRAFKLAE